MKSYWIEENKEKENYKTLKKDIETDICIIGVNEILFLLIHHTVILC